MDIGEFYDRDERRRTSAEIEFGTEWLHHDGVRVELSWVEDTGELYVMREPPPPGWEDPFGGIHTPKLDDAPVEGMEVIVLGTVTERDELERILEGWRDVVGRPDSAHWLVERLDQAGILTPAAREEGPE
jgi:hypothetical protein